MKRANAIGLLFCLLIGLVVWQSASLPALAQTPAAPVADPSGANTGAAGDITAKDAGKPTLEEVAAAYQDSPIETDREVRGLRAAAARG